MLKTDSLREGDTSMDYFPISHIAKLTGIPPVTLRAWERRYGLPKPRRTASGHRVYSMEEVALIQRVTALMAKGYTVSRAVERVRLENNLVREPAAAAPAVERERWQGYRERMLNAIDHFDTAGLEAAYSEPLTLFPIDLIIDEVLLPVLETLGEQWEQREDGIAREHFFSAFLRNKIGSRFNHEISRAQGPALLLACLPGEAHEMGLMLFGLAACARGYRVLYLGADLPLMQLLPVLDKVRPRAVALSGTTVPLSAELRDGLRQIKQHTDVPLYLGGDLSEQKATELSALGVIPVGRPLRQGLERIIGEPR
jgi:DNA-binding transcriptional MerR regulator